MQFMKFQDTLMNTYSCRRPNDTYMSTIASHHSPDIEPKQEGNEDARDDYVTQAKHCKVVSFQSLLQ